MKPSDLISPVSSMQCKVVNTEPNGWLEYREEMSMYCSTTLMTLASPKARLGEHCGTGSRKIGGPRDWGELEKIGSFAHDRSSGS